MRMCVVVSCVILRLQKDGLWAVGQVAGLWDRDGRGGRVAGQDVGGGTDRGAAGQVVGGRDGCCPATIPFL